MMGGILLICIWKYLVFVSTLAGIEPPLLLCWSLASATTAKWIQLKILVQSVDYMTIQNQADVIQLEYHWDKVPQWYKCIRGSHWSGESNISWSDTHLVLFIFPVFHSVEFAYSDRMQLVTIWWVVFSWSAFGSIWFCVHFSQYWTAAPLVLVSRLLPLCQMNPA